MMEVNACPVRLIGLISVVLQAKMLTTLLLIKSPEAESCKLSIVMKIWNSELVRSNLKKTPKKLENPKAVEPGDDSKLY